MKKTILIITPHLSTGGCPQVVLNKIELLKETYNLICIEWECIAWTFVVQRNRIIELLGDNFVSLPEDKTSILKIIDVIRPIIFAKTDNSQIIVQKGIVIVKSTK